MQSKICLIKKFTLIIVLIFFSKSDLHSAENKIVVKVDNEIITELDIENEINYLKALNPKLKNLDKKKVYSIGKNSVIKELIKKKEILKYFKEIKLENKFKNEIIKNRYSVLGLENKVQFIKYLNNRGISIDDIERKISIEAIWNQIIFSKFSSKVKIDKTKLIRQVKQENNKKLKSYLLSEIVFSLSNKKEYQAKLNKIKKMINENGFENAALSYSIANSGEIGGKIGWIKENTLNKNIKDTLDKLKIGEITEPIFINNGYLILKINEINLTSIRYDEKQELDLLIKNETNKQLNILSINYFNKIKKDIIINDQ